MLSKPGRTLGGVKLGLALLAIGAAVPEAFGQGNTFNPYGNSGYRDYREFSQPMYSNDPSLPGQARLQGGVGPGGSRANQFDAYSESLDGRDLDAAAGPRRATPGVPYYRAFRQYDKEYDRVAPREKADQAFADRLKQRNKDYKEALAERDPAKRSQLLKKLERDSLDRPLASANGRTSATARGAAPTTARASATAHGRTPTPPPGRALPGRPASPAAAAQPGAARPASPSSATTNARAGTSARNLATPAAPSNTPVDPSTIPTPAPR